MIVTSNATTPARSIEQSMKQPEKQHMPLLCSIAVVFILAARQLEAWLAFAGVGSAASSDYLNRLEPTIDRSGACRRLSAIPS